MKRLAVVFGFLAACTPISDGTDVLGYGPEPTLFRYTPPEDSGLIGVRPYPSPQDVCMVIGENDATRELLDDAALLIGCPKHEFGAIADRVGEGALVVGHAKHWSLFSLPQR